MNIKIKLRTRPNTEFEEREVEKGTSLEELLLEYRSHLPYGIMAAIVDNRLKELTYVIERPCTIKFLDMRNNAADRVYQRSLCLVYLKAIQDVFGEVETNIYNALNRGIYTEIETPEPITDSKITEIEKHMWELVDANLPILHTVVNRSDIESVKESAWSLQKLALLKNVPDVHYIAIYELDGYKNYFYGQMVPSTRYLQHFELKRYQKGIILRYPHPSNPDSLSPYVDDSRIYTAYEEGRSLGNLFNLNYVSDLNREISEGHTKDIIAISEKLHSSNIDRIAENVCRLKKRVILIAGPSSSGKTTFSKRVIKTMEEKGIPTLYLGTDDYFVERSNVPKDEFGRDDFEGLNAVDINLFNSNINELLEGEETDLPVFDFLEGKKKFGQRPTKITPDTSIVIEGIHALNAAMTGLIPDSEKYKIYISPLSQINLDDHNRIPTTDVRLIRRMVRDNRTRGYSVVDTMRLWPSVRRGEDVNIFPYNSEADVVFNSSLLYELPVLRRHAENLLAAVDPDIEEYAHAVWLLDFLRFFTPIEDESDIPADSVIREFIGGSEIV